MTKISFLMDIISICSTFFFDNIILRFAEFIEGSPHLTEGEVMEYSQWEYTDDDDDEDGCD